MLYATRFRAPDAFAFVEKPGRTAILLSDLEVDRGRREAKVDDVISYSRVEKEVQGAEKKKPAYAKVVATFLKHLGVRRVLTPADFPLGLARALKKEKIQLQPANGSFWPNREIKAQQEIEALDAAERIAEAGMARGHEVLRAAKIGKDGRLLWNRRILTAEILRREMEIAVVPGRGRSARRYNRCLRRTGLRSA